MTSKGEKMATLVTTPTEQLSNDEILRYSRHLIMPEVAMEGQLKLKQAKVLCIGAGGLGRGRPRGQQNKGAEYSATARSKDSHHRVASSRSTSPMCGECSAARG
jgi:hypothetical protein